MKKKINVWSDLYFRQKSIKDWQGALILIGEAVFLTMKAKWAAIVDFWGPEFLLGHVSLEWAFRHWLILKS